MCFPIRWAIGFQRGLGLVGEYQAHSHCSGFAHRYRIAESFSLETFKYVTRKRLGEWVFLFAFMPDIFICREL